MKKKFTLTCRLVFNTCRKALLRSEATKIMTDSKINVGSQSSCDMGVLVQTLNPMTGQREWKMVPEDYDYQGPML
jgi:hypothetical protein